MVMKSAKKRFKNFCMVFMNQPDATKKMKNACSKFLEPTFKENGLTSKRHVGTPLDTSPSHSLKHASNCLQVWQTVNKRGIIDSKQLFMRNRRTARFFFIRSLRVPYSGIR